MTQLIFVTLLAVAGGQPPFSFLLLVVKSLPSFSISLLLPGLDTKLICPSKQLGITAAAQGKSVCAERYAANHVNPGAVCTSLRGQRRGALE